MILKINDRFFNRTVENFNDVEVELNFNAVASTFQFAFDFVDSNFDHKELACVTHFHDITIDHNNERLITGVLLSQSFLHNANRNETRFGGYSKSGQTEDCQIAPSIYPLQSTRLSIEQIANKLVRPFKPEILVKVDPAVQSEASKVLTQSTASATQTVKGYLTEIARQRDLIISHDEFGDLLITKPNTEGQPILDIDMTSNKTIPAYQTELIYNGQNQHSHITVMGQPDLISNNAREFTIRNPYVVGSVFRPRVVTQSSGDDNDTPKMARRELGNELSKIKVKIYLDRWVVNDKIIRPNNIISLIDPSIYIFKKSLFFIESVKFTGNAEKQQCVLTCTLPEAYNDNKNIVNIFEGINIHPRP
jgi:prophage tail gpP-like protein